MSNQLGNTDKVSLGDGSCRRDTCQHFPGSVIRLNNNGRLNCSQHLSCSGSVICFIAFSLVFGQLALY